MARTYTGNFTTDAAKVAKKAERLTCQVTDDGTIFVTDGHFAWKMNPLEYAAIVQPVSRCDAGNWSIDKNGKRESTTDVKSIFSKAAKAVEDFAPLATCPLCFTPAKAAPMMASYYNAAADFAAFYNKTFIASIAPGATLKAAGPTSAAIAYCYGEPVALVMPIMCDKKIIQSVKAYFNDETEHHTNSKAEADELRKLVAIRNDELLQARDQLTEQAAELAAMRDQFAAMQAAPVEQKPEPKTAAEIIAARFAELPGVTATVKSAQTAAPVVWLAGDTEHNADAIKAAGAKWSSKKAAYYYRVA